MTKRDVQDGPGSTEAEFKPASDALPEIYPEEQRAAFKERIRDPAAARKYLRDAGFIDETGQLSAKYRRS